MIICMKFDIMPWLKTDRCDAYAKTWNSIIFQTFTCDNRFFSFELAIVCFWLTSIEIWCDLRSQLLSLSKLSILVAKWMQLILRDHNLNAIIRELRCRKIVARKGQWNMFGHSAFEHVGQNCDCRQIAPNIPINYKCDNKRFTTGFSPKVTN